MKSKNVVVNPKLSEALKGFVPVFGNQDDLKIVNDLTKLHKKLATIDCEQFREIQDNPKHKSGLTTKMQEIQKDEVNLIQRITKRNLDF